MSNGGKRAASKKNAASTTIKSAQAIRNSGRVKKFFNLEGMNPVKNAGGNINDYNTRKRHETDNMRSKESGVRHKAQDAA
jgi:hypothetical protein